MDVVISTYKSKYQDMRRAYCLRSLKFLSQDTPLVMVDAYGEEAGTSDFEKLLTYANSNGSEEFIFMPDSCILLAPFTPARYVNTGMLLRRPHETELMTGTIRFLLGRERKDDGSRRIYDFELDIPMVFSKSRVREMAQMVPHRDMLPRTLYCNLFPEPMIRIVNPAIEQWSHNDDPELAVISLSDTALAHRQCQKWLERKLPAVADQAVAVR